MNKPLLCRAATILIFGFVSGCATFPGWLASSGPSAEQIRAAQESSDLGIRVVEVNSSVAHRITALEKNRFFSRELNVAGKKGGVGPGDVLEVSIWEAPPATLFGAAVVDAKSGMTGARASTLPAQMVSEAGTIKVPFVGAVQVAGLTTARIEERIAYRLRGKANQAQVIVRRVSNATANVTVMGEVGKTVRMPLSAKGERLLDAIAAAGGVQQPMEKLTVQITRGPMVIRMPLARVVQSPVENVPLVAGDVVTVLFQPLSLSVLGATGTNQEINFEDQGISLAQALARAGGLHSSRADARGVFIFRFEDPRTFEAAPESSEERGSASPVPVVYQLDMKNPASFLVAQNFPMRNDDVMYVANAPSAELQKFLSILTSSIFSANSVVNLAE